MGSPPPPAAVAPPAAVKGAKRVAFVQNWPPPHEGTDEASTGVADTCDTCGAYTAQRRFYTQRALGPCAPIAQADELRCVRCELAARPSQHSSTLPWPCGSRGPCVGLSRARTLMGHPMEHANGDAADRQRRNAEVRWSVATPGGAMDPEPLTALSLRTRGRGGERRLEGW